MAPDHQDHHSELLPFLFAGLSVASVLAILGAVVGELVGARSGLGDVFDAVQPVHGIAPVFAVILLLAVIGFLVNALVELAERHFCFWAYRQRGLIGT